MADVKYTPTQLRFLSLLGDGMAHPLSELKTLLDDELSGNTAVTKHICLLRRKVRGIGRDIVYRMNGTIETGTYRLVRLVVDEEDDVK